ncbi:pilin [Patescibacteria group bacterium]|nr:pilin [Patescibacteria group bacterium]
MKKSVVTILLISLGVVLIPQIAFAKIELNIPIGGVTSVDDLGEYIRIFYEFFVTSAGVLAAVMMVIGGYKWVTAAGNASMIDGAKELVMSAVMGLVLALTSYLILNAINPNITSLAPLVIPGVDPLTISGVAKRPCSFMTELDRTDPDNPKPVKCGKGLYINPDVNDDKCMGVMTDDDDNICMLVHSGGAVDSVSASEETNIRIQNHNVTGQTVFDVNTDNVDNEPSHDCGVVLWSFNKLQWIVGAKCENATVEGEDYKNRCAMDGKFGDFVRDTDVCSYVRGGRLHVDHGITTNLEEGEVRFGCGTISNMHCAGTP